MVDGDIDEEEDRPLRLGSFHEEHPEDEWIKHNQECEKLRCGVREIVICDERGHDLDAHALAVGFESLDVKVTLVRGEYALTKEWAPSPRLAFWGSVHATHAVLRRAGKVAPSLPDYPDCLAWLLGRTVWQTNLDELRRYPPIGKFIKPVRAKAFEGFVLRSVKEFEIRFAGIGDELQVLVSDPLVMAAEYRTFILRGEILDVRRYKGAWDCRPNKLLIERSVVDFQASGAAPAAYTLDFAVTDQGTTVLVETNDGYAFGGYGLDPVDHASMVAARWVELMKKDDSLGSGSGK